MNLDRDLVAQALDGYDIGDELGRGANGIVLAGTHRRLGREVAIKQLPRAFGSDEEQRRRFLQEAQVLAQMDHPHIVPIYDYLEHHGVCLLVMERLPGGTLLDRALQGMTPQESCATMIAACSAVQHAHERGTLHRDLKPENIMFTAGGMLKVTDFGIAKVVGSRTMATQAGFVIGTPAYMAPEQAQGLELTPATDIYALATVAYELLTGELPHPDSGDPVAILYSHVHEPPTPLCEKDPDLPVALGAAIDRGLSRDPADRPESARQLAIEIAAAAGQAWGVDWVAASGVPVVSTAPGVRHARSDTTEGLPEAKPATVVTPVAPAPVTGWAAPTSAPPASAPPALAPPAAAPPAAAPPVGPPVERSGRPRWLVPLAAVVVLGIVALVVVLAGGGGKDDPKTVAGAGGSSTTEATTSTTDAGGTGARPVSLLVSSKALEGWSSEGEPGAALAGETLAGSGLGPQLAECTGAPTSAFDIDEVGPSFTSPNGAFFVVSAAALDEEAAAHVEVLRQPKMLECLTQLVGDQGTVSRVTHPPGPAGVTITGWLIAAGGAEPRFQETVVLQRGTLRLALKVDAIGEPFPTTVRDQLVREVAEHLSTLPTD